MAGTPVIGTVSGATQTTGATLLTPAQTVQEGATIIVEIAYYANFSIVPSLSDSESGSYTQLQSVTQGNITVNVYQRTSPLPKSSTSFQVTAMSLSSVTLEMIAIEVLVDGPVDVSTSGSGSATMSESVSETTNTPDELVLFLGADNGATFSSWGSEQVPLPFPSPPSGSLTAWGSQQPAASAGPVAPSRSVTANTYFAAVVVCITSAALPWPGLFGKPSVTVSPIGLQAGTLLPNNGADYGPDTISPTGAATVTGGVNEAIAAVNALGGGQVIILPGSSPITITASIELLPGVSLIDAVAAFPKTASSVYAGRHRTFLAGSGFTGPTNPNGNVAMIVTTGWEGGSSGLAGKLAGTYGMFNISVDANSYAGVDGFNLQGVDHGTLENCVAANCVNGFVFDSPWPLSGWSSVTTLNGGITATQTSITVTSGTGIGDNQAILIDDEWMLVTAGGGTSTLTVTRGILGTTPATHSNGATVYLSSYDAPAPGEMYIADICVVDCSGIGIVFYSGGGTGWTQILGRDWQVLQGTPFYGIYIQGAWKVQVVNVQLDSVYFNQGIYLTDAPAADGSYTGCYINSFSNVLFGGSVTSDNLTKLGAAVSSATQTTITLDSLGYVQINDYLVISSEAMLVTAINAALSEVTVTRGQLGTSALTSIANGTKVSIGTVLASAITATQTSITLASGGTAGIQDGDYLLIGSELLYVVSGGGTTALTVVRGALGTTAASASSLAKVTFGVRPDVRGAFAELNTTMPANGNMGVSYDNVISAGQSQGTSYPAQSSPPSLAALPGLLTQTGVVASSGTNANVVFFPGYRVIGLQRLIGRGTLLEATPALPGSTGSGNATYNPFPFRVVVYMNGPAGIHIVAAGGTLGGYNDTPIAGGSQSSVELEPGEGIYFATTVPSAWTWRATG